ncbi:MAG: ATP-binding protein [Akkermansiaceae bacterium]|nr:ATP-binding protein [Armatimonadota bacterium]
MATLYLICGMIGSGKTILAKQLETSRSAFRFSPDEWIKSLLVGESDTDERDRIRGPVEALQWVVAQNLLKRGVSVVLENGFWSKEERTAYLDTAKGLGANVELHYLDVPEDELWRRTERRNMVLPEGSFPVTRREFDESLRSFTPPDSAELMTYNNHAEISSR